MRWKHIVTEEVYGGAAIGYHRTKNVNLATEIGKSGFRAGGGNTYGTGIYLTYSFEDQQEERMKSLYGPYIVRSKVNIAQFLIFDEDIAGKVHGKNSSIEKQFAMFGIPEEKLKDIRYYDYWHDDQERLITSKQAKIISSWATSKNIPIRYRGMIFTGEQDGQVIVAYSPRDVIPFSFCRAVDLKKSFSQLRWRRYEKPPINTPVETDISADPDAAMRYFKRAGYTAYRRGKLGGVFAKKANDDWIVITVQQKQYGTSGGGTVPKNEVAAYVTKINPQVLQKAAVLSDSYFARRGIRLMHRSFPARVGVEDVLADIENQYAKAKTRISQKVAFGKDLLMRITPPGEVIEETVTHGRDYGDTEVILSTESGIQMKIENPYEEMVYGLVRVSKDVVLGFNGGNRDGGDPNVDTAYHHLIKSLEIEARMLNRLGIRFSGSNRLSEKFAADLDAVLTGSRQ